MKKRKVIICVIAVILVCVSSVIVIAEFIPRTEKKTNEFLEKPTHTTPSMPTEAEDTRDSEYLPKAEALRLYTEAYTIWCDWINSGYLKYEAENASDNSFTEIWENEDGTTDKKWFWPTSHETINSIAALKEVLSKYFLEDIYSSIVDKHFTEKDGVLYGSIDFYGETPCVKREEATASLLLDGKDKVRYEFTLPLYWPGDRYATEFEKIAITFVATDEGWKISDGKWEYDVNLYEFPDFS